MSKRKEIKEKEQLQAEFRLSLSRVSSRIEGWLNGEVKSVSKDKKANDQAAKDRLLFESLPIIAPGKGLNIVQDAETGNDVSGRRNESMKIGDFVRGEGKKSKMIGNKIRGIKRRQEDSASMRALRNKLRDTRREKIRRGMNDGEGESRKHGNQAKGKGSKQERGQKGRGSANAGDSDSSSDSDSEDNGVEYRAKKVNRGKRPF